MPSLIGRCGGGSSSGGTPSVATFYRSTSFGDPALSVPPDTGGPINIPWLHAKLPSDGTITGPFTGNVYVEFEAPGICIEFLNTQWDDAVYLKEAVLGTTSRIVEADQPALGNAGQGQDTAHENYGDATSFVRPNAHKANDLIHAYTANGDTVNHNMISAYLVIYFWPAPGYTGGIPGWPV